MEDEKIQNFKLQYYMEKCGLRNRYQIVSLLIIFCLYGTAEFLAIALPLLEINPYVEIFLDKEHTQKIILQVNYTICNNELKKHDYSVLFNDSKSSLVTYYEIFCDENLVSFIGSSLFLGVMLGSFISYIFSDKIGRKKTIIIFSILYSFNLLLFFIIGKNIYLLYFCLALAGLFYSIIILSSILLLNEVIDIDLTAIFTTIIYNAYPVFGLLYTFLFRQLDNWKYIFGIIAILNILSTVLLCLFLEESPRFYFGNKNLNGLKHVLRYISNFNRIKFNSNEVDELFKKNPELEREKYDEISDENTDEKEEKLLKNYASKQVKFDDKIEKQTKLEDDRNFDDRKEFNAKDHNSVLVIASESNAFPYKEDENMSKKTVTNEKIQIKRAFTANPDELKSSMSKKNIKNKFVSKKTRDIHQYSILDLVRYKSQRANFLIICLIWITSAVIFYALTIRLKRFSEEIYTNLYIIYIVDIITCLFFGYMSNTYFFGRIKTIQLLMIISFVTFFLCLIIQNGSGSFENYVILISRICFNSIFCIIYFISTEIYPTVLRAKGLAYNSAFSRLGGLLAPFLVEKLDDNAKFKLFCFLNFVCSVLSFYLPETIGKHLEEKIPEENSEYESEVDE